MSPAYITMCQHSLASRLGAGDVGLGESLGGLGRVLDGLAEDGNTALLAGDDTDGLKNRSLVCRACFRIVYVDRSTLSLTKPACCKSELVSPVASLGYVRIGSANLAGVLVGQVERVRGELSTTIAIALGEEAVVVTCEKSIFSHQTLGLSILSKSSFPCSAPTNRGARSVNGVETYGQ